MSQIFRPVVLEWPASVGSFTQNIVAAIACDILNAATTAAPVPEVPRGASIWIAAALDPYQTTKGGNKSRALATSWVDQKALYEGLSETGQLVEANHGRTEKLAPYGKPPQDLVVSLFDFDGAPFDSYWRGLQKFASHWRYAILASIKDI